MHPPKWNVSGSFQLIAAKWMRRVEELHRDRMAHSNSHTHIRVYMLYNIYTDNNNKEMKKKKKYGGDLLSFYRGRTCLMYIANVNFFPLSNIVHIGIAVNVHVSCKFNFTWTEKYMACNKLFCTK